MSLWHLHFENHFCNSTFPFSFVKNYVVYHDALKIKSADDSITYGVHLPAINKAPSIRVVKLPFRGYHDGL